MPYTKQQWHDDTTTAPYGPINGTRLNYIEDGIATAQSTAESAGGGAGIGTALPLVDGAASAGVGTVSSAVDHVHPTDTSRAPLASPTFTGTPAAPTAAQGTNTTQLATTAMVHSETVLLAPLASPTFSGTPSLPTATVGITQSAADSSTKLATTAFVTTADNLKAPLASPTFTGTATLPAVTGNTTFLGTATLPTGSLAVNSLAPGTAAQVLTTTAGTAVWATPSGGGALTTANSIMGTDVTMTTAGTYYDGPAITCAAGTWLLVGKVHILAGTTAVRTFTIKLWDGTASYAVNIEAVTGTGTAGNLGFPVSALVTPATSTQYKISATSTLGTETLKGTGVSLLSYLSGVKVA